MAAMGVPTAVVAEMEMVIVVAEAMVAATVVVTMGVQVAADMTVKAVAVTVVVVGVRVTTVLGVRVDAPAVTMAVTEAVQAWVMMVVAPKDAGHINPHQSLCQSTERNTSILPTNHYLCNFVERRSRLGCEWLLKIPR